VTFGFVDDVDADVGDLTTSFDGIEQSPLTDRFFRSAGKAS
jgi:hypothetical protein